MSRPGLELLVVSIFVVNNSRRPGPLVGAILIINLPQRTNETGKEGQEFPLFMLAEAIYMSWVTFELLVRLVS